MQTVISTFQKKILIHFRRLFLIVNAERFVYSSNKIHITVLCTNLVPIFRSKGIHTGKNFSRQMLKTE